MSSVISLPFNFTSFGSIDVTEDPAKAWQDRVIVAVMTGLNERVMRPTYGSDVGKAVGESLNDAINVVRQSIEVSFSRWLKELSLLEVTGSVDPQDDYLIIQIKYNYRALNLVQTLNIKTAILSRSGDVLLEVTSNGR
jgi:phage baseplate assembly protein W